MVRVRFEPSGREVLVPTGTSLHDAAVRAGLPVANACGADGVCVRCGLRILAGEENLSAPGPDERRALAKGRLRAGDRLSCETRILGPVTVTALYW